VIVRTRVTGVLLCVICVCVCVCIRSQVEEQTGEVERLHKILEQKVEQEKKHVGTLATSVTPVKINCLCKRWTCFLFCNGLWITSSCVLQKLLTS
jgi:hypothetical protein